MTGKKTRPHAAPRESAKHHAHRVSKDKTPLPTVSGRWLLAAGVLVLMAAVVCTWGALCVLFWQGSWQLLYHPAGKVERTPASIGVPFEPVAFAATEEGTPRLTGWWIAAAAPSAYSRYTVLYLHGQNGNLGDTVDVVARLHAVGVNVLAFDYRGYGQSKFVRPSEAHWREDADWALSYLTQTRHVPLETIVLDGSELGANLALEEAGSNPEIAGVMLESPPASPMDAIYKDPRAEIVPAWLLVRDRFDLSAAAAKVKVPVLWFEKAGSSPNEPKAYSQLAVRKMLVWMNPATSDDQAAADAMKRWLDDLGSVH